MDEQIDWGAVPEATHYMPANGLFYRFYGDEPGQFWSEVHRAWLGGCRPIGRYLNELIERPLLPALPSPWINCKDQLPEAGQVCLLYRPDAPETQDSVFKVAVYTGKHFACYVQPSHWQPITVPELLSPHMVTVMPKEIDQ